MIECYTICQGGTAYVNRHSIDDRCLKHSMYQFVYRSEIDNERYNCDSEKRYCYQAHSQRISEARHLRVRPRVNR